MASRQVIAACTRAPGVMATRTLKSPRERLATLLTVPFMNCGAKLPVYALLVGLLIERHEGIARRRWLIASIVANVGVLAIFKYYGFLTENIEAMVRAAGWSGYSIPDLGIILPIGLSFIGTAWSEATLLRLGYAFERRAGGWRAPSFRPSAG